MMKKVLALILVLVLVLSLSACSGGETPPEENVAVVEIAMIIGTGAIEDKSFNQCTWESIKAFGKSEGIATKYYKPTEQNTDAYLASIQLAVEDGAKIIVTPGVLFETAIFIAQDQYPKVKFILIDGFPNNGDFENLVEKTADNAVGVKFAEEQLGFLAGYAAVKDGYTKLGYMGGMAVPAVIRFGYGFVQGAEFAAEEMGIANIDMKYHYTGGFEATPEAQALAASWYADGTEVIFACGGAVGTSVMAAADASQGKVIGVDADQSTESDAVITFAIKGLSESVSEILEQAYSDSFPGGANLTFDATADCVKLSMDTSKFTKFTQDDYDAIYAKLVAGDIELLKDLDAKTVDKLPVKIVKVTPIN